ncbi:hypothetical protein DL546_009876 [Coniochaeta pulveracea]|uniref:Uncharacterized protein n=1 Tax=Coniochaeta pulveracea TaxID=177199 RepID=A0A420YPA2_9PEZI|nr:hypothetical protein DL546_009876 [Coniochaeta pulveracea]
MTTTPIRPCLGLEVDDDPGFNQSCLPSTYDHPLLAQSACDMDVDDKASIPTDRHRTNLRLRRQQSSQFNNNPSNCRTIQDLVEGMIATGSQCNVQQALTVAALTPSPPLTRLEAVIEPQRVCDNDPGFRELEVDEAYLPGAPPVDQEKEELCLIENMLSLRRAGGPVGIRKMGPLQYRGSADSAFRCANVVRSRPRMRKRKTHGNSKTGSGRSSVVSSSISSPVIPPSLPDDLSMPPPEFWPRRP